MSYPVLPGLTPDGVLYQNLEMGTVEAVIPPGVHPTCHPPATLELPNGDLLCCWFAGTYEGSAQGNTAYSYDKNPEEKKPWSSNVLKILLIIGIVLVGAPIVIPCALAIIVVAVSCIVGLFCFFFAIVIGFAAIAIIGVVLVCAGLIALIPEIAVGLALIGTGLILGVIGTVGTLAGVKLCIVMIPGIIRGIVWLCRKPFQRKAVA